MYDKTLMTVWQMALEKLKLGKHKVAIDVINMISHMDGNFINIKAFLYHHNLEDEFALNEIIDVLCEYSLISKIETDVTQSTVVTMHKLVQKVLKLHLTVHHLENTSEVAKKDQSSILQDLETILRVKSCNSIAQLDNDEENIWFLHFKKLWTEGSISNNPILEHNGFVVAFQRGEQNFHNDVVSKFFLQEVLYDNDNASSLKSNVRSCISLASCGQHKVAMDSMKKILVDYKKELKSKNFVVL